MFEHSLGSLFLFPLLKGVVSSGKGDLFRSLARIKLSYMILFFSPCPENFE